MNARSRTVRRRLRAGSSLACTATARMPACSAAATMRNSASFRRPAPKPCPCRAFDTAKRASTITGTGYLANPLMIRVRGIGMRDFADDERVEANDRVTVERDVGTRRVRRLVLQRVSLEEAIQCKRPAVKAVNDVYAGELLDAERHRSPLEDAGLLQQLREARQISRRGIEMPGTAPTAWQPGRSADDRVGSRRPAAAHSPGRLRTPNVPERPRHFAACPSLRRSGGCRASLLFGGWSSPCQFWCSSAVHS